MDFREEKEEAGEKGSINRLELMLRQDDDDSNNKVDLERLFINLFKGKRIIFTWLLASIVLSMAIFGIRYSMRDSAGTVSAVVNFDFRGLEKGQDPYGNAFDVTEIKNAEIITKALQETGLEMKDVTVEDIRRNINISGIVPQNVINQINIINKMAEKDPSKLEMLNDISYMSTQYKIDFSMEKNLDLNAEESLQLLRSIINEYREYFIDKFSDKYVLSNAVSVIDITKYDYAEVILLAEEQISTMRNYVLSKSLESPNFRAKSTGMTFDEILSNIDLVNRVDLNRVQSLIYTFNLSKDATKLAAVYQNHITDMDKKAEQKRGEASTTRQIIDSYKKDTSLMMLGGEGTEPVEMTSGSAVYDNLVKQANDAENEAVNLISESNYYRSLINKLTGEETTDIRTKQKYSIEVQEELTSLLNRLGEITDLTNETVDSYFETEVYSTAVKTAIEPIYSNNIGEYLKSGLMITAILAIASVMISVMNVLAKGVFKVHHVHDNN